ncbi:MAG: four helix bundle protein [Phycisphaerales bacterium]|nr:four helix bundle protein [Phycisphaerales bacterium]
MAWQKTFALGLDIYQLTKRLPEHEKFGLISQLRRGSVSIASNIAEGYGRQTTAEYLRFLRIARGCLYELDTQLLFCVELQYLERNDYTPLLERLDECGRILAGLIRSLENGQQRDQH